MSNATSARSHRARMLAMALGVGMAADSSPRYWPTAWTPTMPGVRARRWSGNWPPNPEADVSAPVEL
jgi:hypothetical protein